jgi:nicotinamidase-related amidase/type 1 glutamine amidotransferase
MKSRTGFFVARHSRLAMLISVAAVCAAASREAVADDFNLSLRHRVETSADSGRFHTVYRSEKWNPKQTAVIVCDMWDLHHCLNATLRGGEVAPRMNEVLNKARAAGALIIHAPSSCTGTYSDHPARKRAASVKRSNKLPDQIGAWCYKIPEEEQGDYPIDQTDGGEDDDLAEHAEWAKKLSAMGRNPKAPWKSQTDLLDIDGERDFISDNGEEIWSILETHNCSNVILLGVHTNMCVLGRPFGLRQMSKNGKNVVLMRDMTDTMYNPAMRPFVSHFTGTDLIVEHIEKWVCPTISSNQLIGGKEFRFKHDQRPHVVIVTAEQEYDTNKTLPPFALSSLGKEFKVSTVFANDEERNELPGIDVLNDADVLLLSVRRRVLPPQQMAVIRKFVESGKPIVGIRTANHAFSLRGKEAPAGLVAWETWDADIFGGHYSNHHGAGPKVIVGVSEGASEHPILRGVNTTTLTGTGSLYMVSPLKDSATALLTGTIPGKPAEPLAWVNVGPAGNRTFYTSLGAPGDFEQEDFRQMLANAVRWAVAK